MIGETLWSLDQLLADYPEFKRIERLQSDQPVELIAHRAEQEGIPLVIENYHLDKAWKGDILSVKWIENYWSGERFPSQSSIFTYAPKKILIPLSFTFAMSNPLLTSRLQWATIWPVVGNGTLPVRDLMVRESPRTFHWGAEHTNR
jgi:hypothetical protein